MRICKDCKNPLQEGEYKLKFGNWCMSCRRIYHRVQTARYRQSLRDRGIPEVTLEERRKRNLKDNFNLTLDEYEVMRESQDFKCKICKRPERVNNKALAVDHDHKTGQIRGLLCHHCNVGLGHFEDNEELLMKAISYLKDAVKK